MFTLGLAVKMVAAKAVKKVISNSVGKHMPKSVKKVGKIYTAAKSAKSIIGKI